MLPRALKGPQRHPCDSIHSVIDRSAGMKVRQDPTRASPADALQETARELARAGI